MELNTLKKVIYEFKFLRFDGEERRRRKFLLLIMLCSVLPLLAYVSADFINGNILESIFELLVCIWMFVCLAALRSPGNIGWVYSGMSISFGALFLFLAVSGGVDGSKSYWSLLFPAFIFYIYGNRKGLVWSFIFLLLFIIIILLQPLDIVNAYHYSVEGSVRFVVVFILISLMSFLYGKVHILFQNDLRKSEEQLKSILEAYPDPSIVYDINGYTLYLNPAFTKTFGWSVDEMKGKQVPFVPQNQKEITESKIKEINRSEKSVQFESQRITKSGNIIDVSISAALMKDLKNKITGMVVNLKDITDTKKIQKQLQTLKKMEGIGIVAGGVAHDLNNVLSAQVGYPDLILMDLPENSPLKKPILRIQESGQKAAAIVQDLLTMARRGVVVADVINLNQIIGNYIKSPEYERLKLFHPYLKIQRNIDVDLLNIMGSTVHLFKTIMNLVNNAAEAMPDGGDIIISTHNQYIDKPVKGYDTINEGDYAVIKVSDSGTGISSKDLERIFEPFYTKKIMGRSGTGLGMAVVWGTVKDHKGYIDVQSIIDKGTTFTLYFPVTRKQLAGQKPSLLKEEYMGNGESLLIVDDIKEQRNIASDFLKRLAYSVTVVASGEEAVDYMKDNFVDLIVLDMIMTPGIDGCETYRQILEFHPEQKAIITSGFSDTNRIKKAQELGAGVYIKKPYTFEQIGLAVKKELKKNSL